MCICTSWPIGTAWASTDSFLMNQQCDEFQELDSKDTEAATSVASTGRVEIINMDPTEMELDFIGYDISLVNAYRRIILAEVSLCVVV